MSFVYAFGIDINKLPIVLDLIAHYESSDYSSNTITTPNAPTSYEVSEWKDISKHNTTHHLSQGSASSQPILQFNVVNRLNVIRWDGSNDNIVTSNQWLNGTAARTTVVVWRGDTTETSGVTYRNAGGGAGALYDVTSEVGIRVGGGNRLFDQSVVNADTSVMYVTVFQSAASSNVSASTARRNAIDLGESSVGAKDIDTQTGSSQVGLNAGNQTANAFTGDIAEIIIYNRVLGNSEIRTLESYLGAKWGVTAAL
jgi:hypothetical protein